MTRDKQLPRRKLEYLNRGAAEGQRNEELLQAACQYRDAGFLQHEAERDLIQRAERDGLSTAEAQRTIASAYVRPARGGLANSYPRRGLASRYTFKPTPKVEPETAIRNFLKGSDCGEVDLWEASPIRLPDDFTNDGALLVSMLYDQADKINVVTGFLADGDGKARPADAGFTIPRDELIGRLRKGEFKSKAGGWLRMNPVDGGGVADANVTRFRFALLEFDAIPFELQLSLLAKLPLPIAAILTSGGRSIHAWVQVDCQTAQEYRETVSRMLRLLAKFGADDKNKNPSRLSRLPGVVRTIGAHGDGRQRLLYLNPDPQQKAIL